MIVAERARNAETKYCILVIKNQLNFAAPNVKTNGNKFKFVLIPLKKD
jgi:hypothetical protein